MHGLLHTAGSKGINFLDTPQRERYSPLPISRVIYPLPDHRSLQWKPKGKVRIETENHIVVGLAYIVDNLCNIATKSEYCRSKIR